ncbi:phage virion morphogenesis protein [Nesterenkonia suensis]
MPATIRLHGDGFEGLSLLLDRFGENISNPAPAFDQMADLFAQTQRTNFATGGGYYGHWAPLSPAYAAWKDAHYPGQPVLTRTGQLRESLSSRPLGVEHIDNKRMVLGTQVEYAQFHQHGGGFLPVRRMLNQPTPSEIRQYGRILHRHAFEGVTTT